MSCPRNVATITTSETPQSESELKRLEYRSPSLAKLGKLADLTLTVGMTGALDGGPVGMGKSAA